MTPEYVELLTTAGWTQKPGDTVEFLNGAGIATEFSACEDDNTLIASLYTGKPGERQRICGLFFPVARTREVVAMIDEGARSMTEKKRDEWLRDTAKHDVYVAWQKSRSQRITFPRS